MEIEWGYNLMGLIALLIVVGIITGIIYMIFMLIAKARVLWYLGSFLKRKTENEN